MCKYSMASNENTTSNCSNERIPLIINKDNSKKKQKNNYKHVYNGKKKYGLQLSLSSVSQ